MKNLSFLLILLILLSGCEDDDLRRENPFLLDLRFEAILNTNLPQYNLLNFPGNAVYYGGVANDGIIVANTGAGIVAWDASDPNQVPRGCTRIEIQGLIGETSCQPSNKYSLADGQPLEDGDLQFGLYNYRVEEIGTTIRVFN